jgi:hypothetical protein
MSRAPACFVDYDRWEPRLDALRAGWAAARPFPHGVLDDFLAPEVCRALVAEEFRDVGGAGWIENRHYSQRLRSRNGRGSFGAPARALLDELDSPRFRGFVERLTGESGLFLDLEMLDGGVSAMGRGDFFDLHTDMRAHAHQRRWMRRVNLIVYLTEGWRDEWGGAPRALERRRPTVRAAHRAPPQPRGLLRGGRRGRARRARAPRLPARGDAAQPRSLLFSGCWRGGAAHPLPLPGPPR